MKKGLFLLFLVLCFANFARAQQKWTLSAAATTCTTSNTSCLIYQVDAASGGATFTVGANASANTLQFEATGDGGSTWVAFNVTPSNGTTAVTSTTSTGTWQGNVAGYTAVRIRMSALVSGTATVSIITSLASARAGGGGGSPVASLQVNTISRACNGAANCQTIVGDVLQDTNATYSSGSAVITVSGVMPAFSPTNVIGKKGWVTGRCSTQSEYSCNYDCKYGALTYVSATQVSLPANCTNSSSATANANNFIFGTDDCTAVSTFFQSVFYPGGLNTLNPQVLNLPQGSFLSSCPPFVATSYPVGVSRWPLTIIGQNTQVYLPPTISSGLGSAVALVDNFAQDAVGDLGFSSFFSNFSFYCGGNDVHDAAGTLVNPSYYIVTNGEDVFQNVYVNGCDWNVSSATPVYGWNCHGGQLYGSGTYAGGNFGMIASDLNTEACNIFGGNIGGSANNSIIFTGLVNLHSVYLNQPQRGAFNNKLSYGIYGNTAAAVLNDFGSTDANIWLDNGKAIMHGSNMGGFGVLYNFNLAGGSLVLDGVYTSANCNMTGGSLFDAAFNAAQGKLCPTGLTNTGGTIFGDASVTGTAAVAGNWALSAGWGTTAALTSISGNSKRTRYTLTASGTGQGANPTITHTFTIPFLTGTVPVCSIKQDGGTQTAVANPFTVGTPTATSVVYTYTGTPGAANTLILEEDCSNP